MPLTLVWFFKPASLAGAALFSLIISLLFSYQSLSRAATGSEQLLQKHEAGQLWVSYGRLVILCLFSSSSGAWEWGTGNGSLEMRHNSNPTVMSVLACVQVCVRSYEARELIWKQVHYCTEVMCERVLSSMYNIVLVSFPAPYPLLHLHTVCKEWKTWGGWGPGNETGQFYREIWCEGSRVGVALLSAAGVCYVMIMWSRRPCVPSEMQASLTTLECRGLGPPLSQLTMLEGTPACPVTKRRWCFCCCSFCLRCLLRSDWQGAIDLILKPRPGGGYSGIKFSQPPSHSLSPLLSSPLLSPPLLSSPLLSSPLLSSPLLSFPLLSSLSFLLSSPILFPSSSSSLEPSETEELSSARHYYWGTRDIAGTLARFPKARNLETQLLLGLQKREPKNDLLGALNFVRMKTLQIFLTAPN